MKYFLTPLTMFLWYLTTYYGLYFVVISMVYMFSLSWLWLIIGYTLLISIIFGISNGLPSLLRYLILKIYGINWFSCIVHSVAGIVGTLQVIQLFSTNPPEVVVGDKSIFILTGMWQIAPVKTILLAFPFVGLVISLIWSTIIVPVIIKLSGEQI